MLDSFGKVLLKQILFCEFRTVLKLRVRGQTCGRGEGADRGESGEPTDAFSSIRKGFSSTRRIEPLAG